MSWADEVDDVLAEEWVVLGDRAVSSGHGEGLEAFGAEMRKCAVRAEVAVLAKKALDFFLNPNANNGDREALLREVDKVKRRSGAGR
jgi:hypothetical protein